MHNHHSHYKNLNTKFFIAIFFNATLVLAQLIFSSLANSSSLFADAIHNLGDVLGLVAAAIGNLWINKHPTAQSTYGMKKISIFAAFINGAILIFSCGAIAVESIYKFFSNHIVHADLVIIIAFVGMIINASTALLFFDKEELNLRTTFLHLFYDALISGSIVINFIIIKYTNFYWLDPAAGLIIAILIMKTSFHLFAQSFKLLIDKVPEGINFSEVRKTLLAQKGVKDLHDLHIWALSTRENALSVHLVMPNDNLKDKDRNKIIKLLQKKYQINHITIQVENGLICNYSCSPLI